MRKLSYFILVIILLLILIFTITPIFIGGRIHNTVNSKIAVLQEQYPDASIELIHYDRHWFSSDARFRVAYKLPFILSLTQNNPTSLTFSTHIEHGPWVSYSVNGEKRHTLAQAVFFFTSPEMAGQIISIANWHDQIKTIFDVDHLTHTTDSSTLSLKELKGHLNFDETSQTIRFDMTLAYFQNDRAIGPSIKDEIINTNSLFRGKLHKRQGLWVGQAMVSREKVSITRNNKSILHIKKLITTVQSNIDHGRANYTLAAQAASLSIADQQLGLLSYNIKLANADPDALSQLILSVKKLYSQPQLDLSNLVSIYTPFFNLIEKGVTLNIEHISLRLPHSRPIALTGTIQFAQAPQSVSLLNALEYLFAQSHVSVPREFVLQQLTEYYQDVLDKNKTVTTAPDTQTASDKAKTTLAEWINNKMLIEQSNGTLELNIVIKNGELLLNGNPPRASPSKAAPAPSV